MGCPSPECVGILTVMARARRRQELFPADRGLVARMVVVSVLTPLVVVAALVACVLLLPWKLLAGMGIALALAGGAMWRELTEDTPERLLAPGEEPELHAAVDRLCLIADLARPEIAVHEERRPNSWIVDAPGRPARLHVTRGLLNLLAPDELEAVLAHELCHVVHRDATVMTVVGLPVEALMRAPERANWGWWPLGAGALLSAIIAFVARFGSTALSRYRELTADAGAARLTGRPAALASALRKIAGDRTPVPDEDLRAVARRAALHVVAVEEPDGLRRLHGRTHPRLEKRIAALERLEHRLAHGRRTLP
jgi:heat shock protein HtpX